MGDDVRQKLQDSDVNEDIKHFIKDNRTGSTRIKNPVKVVGMDTLGAKVGAVGGARMPFADDQDDCVYSYDNDDGKQSLHY